MRAAYRHTSSSPASEWSGVAMKNREHKKENILSWTCWVLQSIIFFFQVWSRRRETYYLGGSARETKGERERESCATDIFAPSLPCWCSTVDIFVSSLLYSLCSVTALQLILLLVLSSRFTRSQQPGPGWRVDHPGTCRCRCTTWECSGCLKKKINFTPRYRYQM